METERKVIISFLSTQSLINQTETLSKTINQSRQETMRRALKIGLDKIESELEDLPL